VLSDERIAQLSLDPGARRPWPLVEAYVQLHAASREAIDRGDWIAVLGPMGIVPGARSFGRFWQLLGPDVLRALQDYVAQEQNLDADPVYAELSYRPTEARMANLTGHPRLRVYEIPVNVAPSVESEKVLALSDLLIGVHEGSFYIRSHRLGREVIVRQSHMLSPMRAPNVCRFLLEVSGQRDGVIPSFRDTLFDRLPFCPRVVRERVVLLPACWNLTPATLKASAAWAGRSFPDAVRGWRIRMRVPRHVYLSASDQRLLLDLEDGTCLAQLEHAIGRLDRDPRSPGHYQKLQEVLPGFDGAWLEDEQGNAYFSELVIPLALTAETAPPRPAIRAGLAKLSALSRGGERQVLPGGRWAYLRLRAAPDRHNQVVAAVSRFADELESSGMADSWFFIRYADPVPHLRVRVRSSAPDGQADVLVAAVEWARHQVEEHAVREFSVDTYRPEIERYGGTGGVRIAEQVFHGDSVGVAAVISGICMGSVTCDPLVATAFTLDRLLSVLRLGDEEKLRLACLQQSSFKSTAEYRGRRDRLVRLLRSVRRKRAEPEAELLDDLYGYGASRCGEAAAAAAALEESQELLRPWSSVIDSIAHMHINRMLGIDRARETEVCALLRTALRSVLSFSSARC
jgi:thiopeptide-type bacteriocin biosynthesis protein